MTASPDTGELPVVTSDSETEGPLIPSPTEPAAWFVSLVPPKDSLPLDFDPLASPPSATVGAAVEMVAVETAVALPLVPDADVRPEAPPAAAAPAAPAAPASAMLSAAPSGPAAPPPTIAPAAHDAAEVPPRLVVPAPRSEASPAASPSPIQRLRRTWAQGLPTSLVVLLVALLLAPGVLLDVARDGSFGLPSTVLFLLAALGTPLVLRPRSLASAVVLPPLAFAASAAASTTAPGRSAWTPAPRWRSTRR